MDASAAPTSIPRGGLRIYTKSCTMTRPRHSRTGSEPITPGSTLPALLTAQEVATWLQISVQAVYAKAERGGLPGATRLGRRLYFVRAELLRSVEQGRVPYPGDAHGGT